MSNVLNEQTKQQVIALGRLGWSLRRIQKATGVRRERDVDRPIDMEMADLGPAEVKLGAAVTVRLTRHAGPGGDFLLQTRKQLIGF